MLPKVVGLPLDEAEAVLCAAGVSYTLCRTQSPFSHAAERDKIYRDYAVRFEQGELTYASFPVLSISDRPREGQE